MASESTAKRPRTMSPASPYKVEAEALDGDDDMELDEDRCAICLQAFTDRALIPSYSHEFCFECIIVWTGTSVLTSMIIHCLNGPLRAVKKVSVVHTTYWRVYYS